MRHIPSGHRTVDLPFGGSIISLEGWPDSSRERDVVLKLRKALERQQKQAAVAVLKDNPCGARFFYLDERGCEHVHLLHSPIVGYAASKSGAGYALVVPVAAVSRLQAELRFYTSQDTFPSESLH